MKMNSILAKNKLASQLAPAKLKREVVFDTEVGDEASKIKLEETIPTHRKIKPTESLWKVSASQKFKAAAILSSKGLQKAGKAAKSGKFMKLDIVAMREMLYARGYGRAKVLTTIHNMDRTPPKKYMQSELPKAPNHRLKESTKFEYDVIRMKIDRFLSQGLTLHPGNHDHQRPDVQRRKGVKFLPPLSPLMKRPGYETQPQILHTPATLMQITKDVKFRDIGQEPLSDSYKILHWLNKNDLKIEQERLKEAEKQRRREQLQSDSLFDETDGINKPARVI